MLMSRARLLAFAMASSRRSMSSLQVDFYSGTGQALSEDQAYQKIGNFIQAAQQSPQHTKHVLFIGENHQDPAAHQLEQSILQHVAPLFPASDRLGLSLEFYDRQCQPVLNEFLSGHLDYEAFVRDANGPGNDEDYKPLLDFCKTHRIRVWAANCPRRYSRLVAQQGRSVLQHLPPESAPLFAPVPYLPASNEYRRSFETIMPISDVSRMNKMLDAQCLWDASMAHTLATAFSQCHTLQLIIHVAGYFHVKHHLGIEEHLSHYLSQAQQRMQAMTVVVIPEQQSEPRFQQHEHIGLADIVALSQLDSIT